MQRVVYILGAGFSAPLGIPVVRHFLMRAKDLYFADRSKFAHFESVLKAVRALDSVKNYLHADLFNIEEVFSIIEMQRQLGEDVPDFAKFIADVVQATTPHLPPPVDGGGSLAQLFGTAKAWTNYGAFALLLARLKLLNQGRYACSLEHEDLRYDVITLNYDRVLELPLDQAVSASQSLAPGLYYRPSSKTPPTAGSRLTLMKLHGDAADGTIVPPTWDKSVRPNVQHDWRQAYEILSSANHVRVVGYSFPPTDTYFRYFLKAALSRTEHLKTVDILTLDTEGVTARRCRSTFAFKFMRFAPIDVEKYLERAAFFLDLERTHVESMDAY